LMRVRPRWGDARGRQGGFWALIELLVVAVIIMLALVYYLNVTKQETNALGGPGGAKAGEPTSTPGVALDRAKGVECQNNLQNVRIAINNYQAQYGAFPPDLQTLQVGVPLVCPVGGEPYQYDASTGQVHCVHKRHEAY
jgi:type II secretory pathway pseudopilin PulG